MKSFRTIFILLIGILFPTYSIFAQDSTTVYFDKDWEETTKESAVYYRKWIPTMVDGKTLNVVRDYFMNGQLQMSGAFLDNALKVNHGPFVYYLEDGTVSKKCSYVADSLEGEYVSYYSNGNVSELQNYSDNKLNGKCTYYYYNKQISTIEFYEKGKLTSFEAYKQNGDRDVNVTKPTEAACFPGGIEGFKNYLSTNLVYPMSAVRNELEGKCQLQFVVDEKGYISKVIVKKGVPGCPECDKEAIRVVESMPQWVPARQNNRVIKSVYNLPVTFKLTDGGKKTRKRFFRN